MLIDLSAQAKFRVTGKDRLRFLNGQLTNDIAQLQPGNTLYACALTTKGKLCADLYVTSTSQAFYLDTGPALRHPLSERLERYIIADDVSLEDVTTDFGLFHILEQDLEQLAEKLQSGQTRPPEAGQTEAPFFWSASSRFDSQGVDIWFPPETRTRIREIWPEREADPDSVESLRIERGIAAWGKELSEKVIPNEAHLEGRAISYTKGCYVGQEVISRIRSVGHVNRCLRGLKALEDISLEGGDKLVADPQSGKEIGSITSSGRSRGAGHTVALGFVKRGFEQAGTILKVLRRGSLLGSVEVSTLPFDFS
jgi:tRNA-modifying protein YgfZ